MTGDSKGNPQAVDPGFSYVDAAWICTLCGVITTQVHYTYGVGNQAAELPILLRAMDPDFLTADFYTNAAALPGPRSWFATSLSAIATPQTLPTVMYALTLLANVAVCGATVMVGTWLASGNLAVGVWSAVAASQLVTFKLGFSGAAFVGTLVSSKAVLPFVCAMVWAAWTDRAVVWAVAAVASVFVHPAFGLEAGIVTFVLGMWQSARRSHWAFMGLAAVWPASVGLGPSYDATQGDKWADWATIEARIRHPHHNLLSAVSARDWLMFSGFSLAVAAAWRGLGQGRSDHLHVDTARANNLVGALTVGTVGVLVCAAWATWIGKDATWLLVARPLRLLWLVKWLGWIVIVAALHRRSLRSPVLGLAVVAAVDMTATSAIGVVAATLLVLAWKSFGAAVRTIAAGLAVATVVLTLGWPSPFAMGDADPRRKAWPPLTLDAVADGESSVARKAKALVPADAVVLAPPSFSYFRVIADRATVVDFKCFPFRRRAIPAWYARMVGSYGNVDSSGFSALAQWSSNYRALDPPTLRKRAELYGATWAVVPVVEVGGTSQRYEIVELSKW